ncbi:CDP-alcohol phosphatidyltransferase [Ectocarpus siliculosus]|uniref:CDP-alcohol phosphatidyltransferase n=1 Tax=Ectocarpus siliculosus TaxID=2880 RepID=D7FT37_ECTSI|nr:CDP-alcohol phosphatidyltransferase [Ectocarpus siliculosus]|eukprot:CBJ31328.1 CDP-alcohol phosphatidyltransferase [Ectocarpus siliculosus]
MVEKESDRVWTVPNMITMGRIAFCPVLASLIVTSQHELALAGLLAASLTDWLDGYIARKWKQTSVLGGFLDPLADKVMVTTVALALGQQGIVPTALVALMVGRDALLIAGSIAYRFKTRREGDAFFDLDSLDYKVTPSTLSKVNTVLQFGTLWLGLTNSVYLVPGDAVFSALCVGTGVATLASGVNYLLVSGLKPKGRLGKRLMIQRENLQERYREREVLVRERMGVGRERMRVRKAEGEAAQSRWCFEGPDE